MELSWSAIEGATYYNVYRTVGSVFGDPPLLAEKITATEYTDMREINADSRYQYSIRAVITDDGEPDGSVLALSRYSDVRQAVRGLPAPSGVAVTAGSQDITLSWSAVTGATKYRIYRATGIGELQQHADVTAVDGEMPSYTDTSLPVDSNTNILVNTRYRYRISTFDTNDQEGEPSSLFTVSAVPTNLRATNEGGNIRISWDAPPFGASGYVVYRAEGAGITAPNSFTRLVTSPIVTTSYLDSSDSSSANPFIPGAAYTYIVRSSVDATGTILSRNSATLTHSALSSVPVANLTAVLENGYVKLNWDAIPGVTEYYIYRAVGSGAATRLMNTTPAMITEPTYIDHTVGYYAEYSYSVQPVNASVMGMRSDAVSAPPSSSR